MASSVIQGAKDVPRWALSCGCFTNIMQFSKCSILHSPYPSIIQIDVKGSKNAKTCPALLCKLINFFSVTLFSSYFVYSHIGQKHFTMHVGACWTSTLVMVPINFWRNSDPFKKRTLSKLKNRFVVIFGLKHKKGWSKKVMSTKLRLR